MRPNFIIIDDEPMSNIISKTVIREVIPKAFVQTFTNPNLALSYIQAVYRELNASNVIIFLDIYMPTLTAWEFLDAFEEFDLNMKQKVKIYILSSSNHFLDKEHAASNIYILDYIEKPLTKTKLENIVKDFFSIRNDSDY